MEGLTQEKQRIVRRITKTGVLKDEVVRANEAVPLAKQYMKKAALATRFEILDVGNARRRPAVVWHSGLMGRFAEHTHR